MTAPASPTIVSAPGKVLIAGGYLVLDPAYSGVVVSTSSRFYTVVRDAEDVGKGKIRVRSPQFTNATWEYSVSKPEDEKLSVEASADNSSKNKFVQLALEKTAALAAEKLGTDAVTKALEAGTDIAIVGDNDFYSQRAQLDLQHLPRTMDSLEKLPPFTPTGGVLADVHKTGLGSSAALITSLVAALLVRLGVVTTEEFADTSGKSKGRRLSHNLAQFVHCLAQGKVGSGFDVSAAIFGSHIYTRFDPAVIQPLMDGDAKMPLLKVLSPTNAAWTYDVQDFRLPPLTRIMLADVDAGSDTPSLVGKVLKWRANDTVKSKALWTALDQLNQSLAQTLLHLSRLHDADPEGYASAVKYISSLQAVQWLANPFTPTDEAPVISTFYEAHRITEDIRARMREMGQLCDVPIEPPEQTRLLDKCITMSGVVGGGVPGAGGYDAIWLLVCDPEDPSPEIAPYKRVQHVWTKYEELDVSPLLARESKLKGARIEKMEDIKGLEKATELPH
ncbi:Phosphomevalonate kinase [Schizophyllum commune H4-8]|uniref:Phosphomevalonate kinase n=1 Tax=Schizophyllum commune (strain H4-8 / FGSC 9210) TaxID=578458 RepID=UPI0021600A19|nr:Phosphomevalonate kinase [Schizophyllum commune H4-8]KAI5889349.1 Phosphomevalonate kinase [Schizophyllum commune H4-8]